MPRKFLAIEPHSDDIAFGMGGTIAKKISEGWVGYCLLMSSSSVQFEHTQEAITRQVRIEEHVQACEFLKIHSFNPVFEPFDADTKLDTIGQKSLINYIQRAIDLIAPEVLFVAGPSFHQDHRAVWEATMTAVRPTRKNSPDKIFTYELPTYFWNPRQYDFQPQMFEDISDFMETKISAARCHDTQIRQEDNELSLEKIKEWAKVRGFMAHCNYAEAFEIVRYIRR